MKTPLASILLFIVAAVVGAVGQFLYKAGADRATGSVASYLLNVRLAAGVVCYILVMVLFVAAFKCGGAMSVLYPIYASTFIWALHRLARVRRADPTGEYLGNGLPGGRHVLDGHGEIAMDSMEYKPERRPIASRKKESPSGYRIGWLSAASRRIGSPWPA